MPLDRIDRRIVAELSADARLSVREIAERIHLSRNATHTRIQHLVDNGVISGFQARVDRKALGLHATAVVTAKVGSPGVWNDVVAGLRALPSVESVLAVTGDIDLVITVNAPDDEALRTVVMQQIRDLPGILSTRTYVVFDAYEGTPPGLADGRTNGTSEASKPGTSSPAAPRTDRLH
ncbi:MAG: Lrp/AsnC family transcriptional regulator [Microbacteriaceae bacterium]|nr:Lrp/AsnC family transcriptional regulator [Microbacteriaceae bacterium]MCL2794151.1 Lrp/AsnC family transcriptional regulator [Microbacteriaceae bacterium]